MIEFKPFQLSDKEMLDRFLLPFGRKGCEYNFSNLFLWGRQRYSIVAGNLVFFSQFNRKSVYLFPVGTQDMKPTLDAIIHDSHARGIPCRLTSLSGEDCALLQSLYPQQFRLHSDRASYDYLYDIHDLADLKGRKFQKKRNHVNRFYTANPYALPVPLSDELLPAVNTLLDTWYKNHYEANPNADLYMEQVAIKKALKNYKALGMEGLVLMEKGQALAVTLSSRLSADTFDVHFEKALQTVDGAYPAINQGLARYLRDQHPELRYLNREDDLGLEGLRKAKESYCPVALIEKTWAVLLEDGYDY